MFGCAVFRPLGQDVLIFCVWPKAMGATLTLRGRSTDSSLLPIVSLSHPSLKSTALFCLILSLVWV